MKAIVNHEYGPPSVLALEDVDVPVMRRDEVLVRVLAAAVNPGDWDVMHGTPYVLRLETGLRRPRNKVLGLAIAGRVEAVGSNASEFRPGDEVYAGIGTGGFAEFVCVPEGQSAPKPSNLTFEQAAAVPITGSPHSGSPRHRTGSARSQGLDQWCVRRRGHLRRADRQDLWRRRYRRLQDDERGPGSFDRCRPCDRLHPR